MATSYKVLIALNADRDNPTVDISADLAQLAGGSFVVASRGYDRAVRGAQPRAGDLAARIENVGLGYSLLAPRPGLAVRLQKIVDAATYNLWQGNTDGPLHTMAPSPGEFRPVVETSALGVFSRLAGKVISTGLFTSITTGAAMAAVLDAADFPAALRDLDTGLVTLPYWWADEVDALQALLQIRQSEGITSDLYEDGQGRVTFRDRAARFTEARSTAAQSVFTSEGAEPRLTGIEWLPEYREIANVAEHARTGYSVAGAASVVWTDPVALYILPPGYVLTLDARSATPFQSAIVPVLGTDYSLGLGSVTVSLSRTSGVSTRITYEAGAAGALLGASSTVPMQLRATALTESVSAVEKNDVDASASQAQYGVQSWGGSMWPVMDWEDMRDNLNAAVTWLKDPHGRVTFGVLAARDATANTATGAREIGDRVQIVEPDLGIDVTAWIERITHEISAPARHFVTYEASVIDAEVVLDIPDVIPTPTGTQFSLSEKLQDGEGTRTVISVNPTTAYVFSVGGGAGHIGVWKTTDAGLNWTRTDYAAMSEDNPNTWDVYYRRWTDPTFDNKVDIMWGRDSGGTLGTYYGYYDLDTDTFSAVTNVRVWGGAGAAASQGSVVVASDGAIIVTLYMVGAGDLSSISINDGATWANLVGGIVETSSAHNDKMTLWPDLSAGAAAGDFLGIYWDYDATGAAPGGGQLSIKRYTRTTDGVVETTIGAAESYSTAAEGIRYATTMRRSDGAVFVVAWDKLAATGSHALKAWRVVGATVTALTDVVTTLYGRGVGITIVGSTLYAFYARGTTTTDDGMIYYKVSADWGVTWGAEVLHGITLDPSEEINIIFYEPVVTSGVIVPISFSGDDFDLWVEAPFPLVVGTGTVEETGHESNPYDDPSAGDVIPPGAPTGTEDQGMMMRGLVMGMFGVEDAP